MTVYNPTGSGNVHIDQVLTQISVAWPNNGFVGEKLFPVVSVKKQSDKYYIFGRESWLPEAGDYRAPGTEANEITGINVSLDTYYAQEHALQIAVTDEEKENADSPLSPDRDATELVTQRVLLGRELLMKNMVTTAANYASGNTVTLSGTATWKPANYATSDPISDMRAGKSVIHSRLFMEPTLTVIPYQVMTALEDHPDFLDRIKYSERAIFNPELLAALLGMPQAIVPGVGYNSAALGQPSTLGYLWGQDVIMAYVPPRAGMKTPAFAYEYQWGGQMVDRWREDKRKSDVLRVARRYDLKFTALGDAGTADAGKAIAGYLIKNTIT